MTAAARNAVSYLRWPVTAARWQRSRNNPHETHRSCREGLRQRAAAKAPQTGAWARSDDCRCMETYPSPSRPSSDAAFFLCRAR